jgi:salicylate hydroxylase
LDSEPERDPILIAGGGIGGLTAALECSRQGYRVEVFEQAGEFSDVGAGIQLSPNPSRVLLSLGLGEALESVAFLPEGTEFRHWRTGRLISFNPLGSAALEKYGAPYYHIHRADLSRLLADAAAAEPSITMHTDAKVTGFTEVDDGVRLQTAAGTHSGRALVGADGIHSVIREGLFGAESPTFTGNVAWRGLVPADRLPEGLVHPVAGVWWGPGKHFVHYYVRRGELVNCVCVVEKAGWEVESWTERGDQAELKQDFSGWHETIQALIDNMDPDACFRWALFDRPPMPRWSRGRVTLLGDACHPTLPFMAQGAAMAIEDAAVLARCLATGGTIPDAFERYEGLRRTRTAGIQSGSRRNAKVFHMRGIKAWARNRAAGRARAGVMDTLYRYNALEAVAVD